jgi:hypothetical protein
MMLPEILSQLQREFQTLKETNVPDGARDPVAFSISIATIGFQETIG